MPAPHLHPLDAKFLKLALLEEALTAHQARQAEDALARRSASGEALTLEQVLLEEGLLSEQRCQELWETLIRAGDTQFRQQVASRREQAVGEPAEADLLPIKDSTAAGRAPEKAAQRLGGYELLEWIGGGGMGSVYRARQVAMDRDVALKVLTPELSSNARYIRRFIREARAAGKLDHGNLVAVYDVGEVDGRYYISMEYVEGRTVKDILRREGRLSVLDSLRIVAQAASALECAHRHKIIHRDIKPDNIMLTPRGVAKLCDLGLAKVLEGPLQESDTHPGYTLGTPHYMSPEQARGEALDARSDLFSLGATLYHMVTGRPPFEGKTPLEILMKVASGAPAPAENLEPLLPLPVAGLLGRLLAKNPSRRPASAEEVRRQAEQLCADIRAGRVFVYTPIPAASWGVVPALPGPAQPDWRPWGWGLAAAVVFFIACLALRALGDGAGSPPPEPPPLFAASAAAGAGGKRSQPGADSAQSAPLTAQASGPQLPAPRPFAIQAAEWESQLAAHPETWPQLLAGLDEVWPGRQALREEDRERLIALRRAALRCRDAAAERDWARRRAAAEELTKAGLLRHAVKLLEDLPSDLRGAPGLQEALQAEATRLRAVAGAEAERVAAELDESAQAGLHLLARRRLAAWAAELSQDGAAPDEVRQEMYRKAAARLQQASDAAQQVQAAQAAQLASLRRRMDAIRALSRQHEIGRALGLCEEARGSAAGEMEKAVYGAERERLLRVRALFAHLARAIASHPGVISERDFRPQEELAGDVVGLDDRHLVVSVPTRAGSATNRANVPLARLSRAEMRRLFDLVYSVRRFAAEDRLGRLAYDLEDPGGASARPRLAELAEGSPEAATWLETLLSAEGAAARVEAQACLAQAEELEAQGRHAEAARSVAAALETLGSRPDALLQARAQALLRLISDARLAGAALGGDSLPLLHGRMVLDLPARRLTQGSPAWTWEGSAPVLNEEGALRARAAGARGRAAWLLAGVGLLELDCQCPGQGAGTLTLSASPLDATGPDRAVERGIWVLELTAQDGHCQGGLSEYERTAPGWTRANLDPAIRRRVWLRLEPDRLSWGLDAKMLGGCASALASQWRVGLQLHGDFLLHGLRSAGRFQPDRRQEEWEAEGAKALREAMLLAPGRREAALREALALYDGHAVLASRACAALAREARAADRQTAGRYWASRALYTCPASDWPAETVALLNDHGKWQAQRERLGQPPLDLRSAAEPRSFE